MRRVPFGSRLLVLGTIAEITEALGGDVPFALLLKAHPDGPTFGEKRLIEVCASANCREICCVGPTAERLHDCIDAVVEDKGRFDIVTTWHSTDPLEEISEYFVRLAGSRPSVLFAAVEDDEALQVALERMAAVVHQPSVAMKIDGTVGGKN